VVHGRIPLSVLLGFFEVLVWVTAIAEVILNLKNSPVLVAGYSAGYAAGNAVGILIEKRLAFGRCVVRLISVNGEQLAAAVAPNGLVLGVFHSENDENPSTLVFSIVERRKLPQLLRRAREIDPRVFWVVERFAETSTLASLGPLPHATGWRAALKKK
jgi:uncharacterized protein YebE (UPF0316 family)